MLEGESSLLATQRRFAAAIRNSAGQQSALDVLAGDAERNRELIAVYRGNAVANAGKALGLTYPVIEKIVGAEFFDGLCRAFWAEEASRSGDLNEYGEGFADFLAHFPHVADLPYLPDVARVEWSARCAMHAADHSAAAISRLADVPADMVGELCFSLQPALTLLPSSWPVASIWQQHQANYVGEVNIDMNDAQCVAIYRLGLHVDVICLSAAEHALWCSALARESLAAMLGAAFAVDESFDVQTALQAGFAREFVVDLSLTASHVWP